MPAGSSVDGRLARRSGLRDKAVDGDVRCDVLRPQAFNTFFHILGLVRADGDACMVRGFLPQYLLRSRAFRRALAWMASPATASPFRFSSVTCPLRWSRIYAPCPLLR